MVKEEIIKHIKANIKQFKAIDFYCNGGLPNFDELDVIVLSKETSRNGTSLKVSILYSCDHPGGCFEGSASSEMMEKELFIGNDGSFNVLT